MILLLKISNTFLKDSVLSNKHRLLLKTTPGSCKQSKPRILTIVYFHSLRVASIVSGIFQQELLLKLLQRQQLHNNGYRLSILSSCEPVEYVDYGQGIAIVIEHAPAPKAAINRRLPPEDALAPVVRTTRAGPCDTSSLPARCWGRSCSRFTTSLSSSICWVKYINWRTT